MTNSSLPDLELAFHPGSQKAILVIFKLSVLFKCIYTDIYWQTELGFFREY